MKKMRDNAIEITVVMAIVGFLAVQYFSSHVTKAEYNEDKSVWVKIQTDVAHLKEGQADIKKAIQKMRSR